MNITKLAKEAGFDLSVDEYNGNLEVDCEGVYYTEVLERFAALVAENEREECAKFFETAENKSLGNAIAHAIRNLK